LIRNGLRATFDGVPDIAVVAECSNGLDAARSVSRTRPHVVLMDINMPRMNGLEATRQICAADRDGETKVVILTMYDQDEHVYEALRAGASAFILKDSPTAKLIEAVREVSSGGALLSPSVTRRLIAEFARRPALRGVMPPSLTDRERDVFRLLASGYRNEDIAATLVLGESTVKSHVQHLYRKLGVRDRVQVVIYAYEHGLLQPGAAPRSLDGR
jgi:DNA-binding NarL/FixJ family response regulator